MDASPWTPSPMPEELTSWLKSHGARQTAADVARVPANPEPKSFVLTTAPFRDLRFQNHDFNPRIPSPVKVNELLASIRRLALLNPLVCAYLRKDERPPRSESVVLIDGRHRFEALSLLAQEDAEWRDNARVDLKIYHGLSRSELFLLATYLNRNRRALKKGEYYRSMVRIYDERRAELAEEASGEPTEAEVFRALHGRELSNRDFDLSIGRLVGLTALQPGANDSWYPLVGYNQNQLIPADTGLHGFAPLTAGNLAELLRHLCRDGPYDDHGKARAAEASNVIALGRLFRQFFLRPVADYNVATATTTGCKFWMMSAFGKILAESSLFSAEQAADQAPLAGEVPWTRLRQVVDAYRAIAESQAVLVNRYRHTSSEEFLERAWSYQTQRDQVSVRLRGELQKRVPASRVRFT